MNGAIRPYLKHPFYQVLLILVGAYLAFDVGIGWVLPLIGVHSAPVPNSVLLQYMLTIFVGLLIYASADEDRWREFKQPIREVLVQPEKRPVRLGLLVALPLLGGWMTFRVVRSEVGAPPTLRSIHPAPPPSITFRGKTMVLSGLENPLRADGSVAGDYELGKTVYVRNCVPCHGDRLDGQGHYAHGFNPAPLNFQDNGTIAQLTESFVFWRVAKGGPGLPPEGTPWNSAMPAWEDFLTEDQIWAVIIYLYEQTGWRPRTWEKSGDGRE